MHTTRSRSRSDAITFFTFTGLLSVAACADDFSGEVEGSTSGSAPTSTGSDVGTLYGSPTTVAETTSGGGGQAMDDSSTVASGSSDIGVSTEDGGSAGACASDSSAGSGEPMSGEASGVTSLVGDTEMAGTEGNGQPEIEAFVEALDHAIATNCLITEIEQTESLVLVRFEDGTEAAAPAEAVASILLDGAAWHARIVLTDTRSFELGYLGDDLPFESVDVELNPFGTAALAARLQVTTPVPGRFAIRVVGQDGQASDFHFGPSAMASQHVLEIYGLYPSYDNAVEITFTDDAGRVRRTKMISIMTAAPPEPTPEFVVVTPYGEPPPHNTVFLINTRPFDAPVYVDAFGKIRYLHDVDISTSVRGLQHLRNGNLAYAVTLSGNISEYSRMGELVGQWYIEPPYRGIHHDLFEMENGNFLLPTADGDSTMRDDIVVEVDRQTSEVVQVWDLKLSLQVDRVDNPSTHDWCHINSVVEDPSDGSIIVSCRRQGVAKLTRDNEVVWILAPNLAWSDEFAPYVLAYDEFTLPPMGQHAASLTSSGSLITFDNGVGFNGLSDPTRSYSRIVEYMIEPAIGGGGSVMQIFEFGNGRPDLFSPIGCDVDDLPSGNFLMTAGATGYSASGASIDDEPDKGRILEVDREGNVLFELLVRYVEPTPAWVYRAEKMTLEP